MFWLIKQVFIVLLSFAKSLATKCVSLGNKRCMARPTLIKLNPIEPNYYAFMISLNVMELSVLLMTYLQNYLFPVKRKIYVKVFNMITKIFEAKALVKHISCDCKCKFNRATCNSNQKWNKDIYQCECKKYRNFY